MGGVAARPGPIRRAGDDDVVSSCEGPADRFKRSATHDHCVTKRKLPETLQVLRQAPGHPVAVADDAIARHGGDDGEARGAGHFGSAERESTSTLRTTGALSRAMKIGLDFPQR